MHYERCCGGLGGVVEGGGKRQGEADDAQDCEADCGEAQEGEENCAEGGELFGAVPSGEQEGVGDESGFVEDGEELDGGPMPELEGAVC